MESIDTSGDSLGPSGPRIVPRRAASADKDTADAIDAATTPPAQSGVQQLVEPLRAVLAKPQAIEQSLADIAAGVRKVVDGTHAAGFFPGPASSNCALPGTPLFCRDSLSEAKARWNTAFQQIAPEAIEQARFSSGLVRHASASLMAVVNPIMLDDQVVGGFGVVGDVAASRELARTINMVTNEVSAWYAKNLPSNQATQTVPRSAVPTSDFPTAASVDVASLSVASNNNNHTRDLLQKLVVMPDLETAAKTLAEHLAQEHGFEKVFIGFGTKGESSRLLAISSVSKFSPKSALTMAAEETLSEARIRNRTAVADTRARSEVVTSGCREIAQLCNAPVVASGPIGVDETAPWGAWVGVWPSLIEENVATTLHAIDQQVTPIAACMQLFDRARGGRLSNACRRCQDAVKTRKGMLTLIALAAFAMLIPVPHSVKCDCELQPVTRRFIPVPYDGVLQEVFVEPGDDIKAQQVLARMEGREIEWELAQLRADYGQAAKQHDSDLAVRDAAASQVARLQMESLQVQIELLNDRLSNLEIKSPIDGVIIGGDPKKKEGARLARGESLFEAGPLSRMVAEILVPDDEISRVAVEQKASLRLDAYPSRKWNGVLLRISPSAEVRNQENVFVAEFEIDNPQHVLRPGMRGRSRISTGVRPLGWNLFHKAWEQLVYGWGW